MSLVQILETAEGKKTGNLISNAATQEMAKRTSHNPEMAQNPEVAGPRPP